MDVDLTIIERLTSQRCVLTTPTNTVDAQKNDETLKMNARIKPVKSPWLLGLRPS